MDFINKVAVVTGGASGIGSSIALAMADKGADIVIADINNEGLKTMEREIQKKGRRVLAVKCDVTSNDDVESLAALANTKMGQVDILVNNAGIAVYGVSEKMTISDYEFVMNINFLGTIRCVLSFLPGMLENKSGYVVITASAAGLNPIKDPYPISKYALLGYAEDLYCYLRPKGIMVSALCPSLVNTNLRFNSPFRGNEQEIREKKLWAEKIFTDKDSLLPDDVARILIEGMKEEKFLIMTHRIDQYIKETNARGRDLIKLEKYLQETYKKQ
jgi:NAD(P)-dependent dehydrogenase (short-subunit alcohol dehydrogenase family)